MRTMYGMFHRKISDEIYPDYDLEKQLIANNRSFIIRGGYMMANAYKQAGVILKLAMKLLNE